jgi:protein ImuB
MTAVRTLVVWCPDWPVAAAGFTRDDPVVVVEGNVVVACSPAARSFGVRAGLRRREAQGRCPEASVLAADPGRDARAFEPVVAALESAFVPAVEVLHPGACAFATRGPSRYFGGDDALAATVHATVAGLGIEARTGIADGVFAATLAARRGRVVERGRSAAFVAPFSVDALRRPELADVLRRLGIRTLGDLAALPAHDVLARFGPDGALAHRLASGLDERPVAARTPPPDLAVTVELDPPVDRVDAAAFAGKALADELCARLAARGLASARILVEAETEHGEALARLWRHEGALTPAAMAERVRWQLDGWLTARASPTAPEGSATGQLGGLTLLRLSPDEVHPDVGRQQGFWGGGAAGDRAARALARVQGLLGPGAVVTGVAAGGRSPGERAALVPWGDPREPPPSHRPDAPWPGAIPAPAPATVHRVAVPADVVDDAGTAVAVGGRGLPTGAPAKLSIAGGAWTTITAWAGPWLLDERWWDGSLHRRRARWQVVTDDGVAHLLHVEGGRWSVEATYD